MNPSSAAQDRALNIPSIQSQVSPEEWEIRVNLAAAYRLVALYGWDDLVFTHITAKLPGTDTFLINPYGLMFDEITASSLVQIDLQGNKVSDSPFDVNPAGFTIHSCIHAARHDAHCVLHTHSLNGVAVSSQREGLLPISQFAFSVLHSLSYHDYEGLALREAEKPRLVANLGQSKFLMLRNHGLLTVGESVAEAFQAMHRFEASCMVQVRALAGNKELIEIDPSILSLAKQQLQDVRRGKGAFLAWPALLRRLDRMSPGFDA
ncbi:4-hydroxy-3-prenylphenylpyruvate oxygenase/4-hydroxy-3-prenylbenzoate synthase [Polaromonas vacuolata]|uniref:4-hydroxy-3-prenylphenylpyruvate oxygenase/4-hydroxy-3-prenylbenzoate synthase n=1 Tax=Polaromonas vacuolata TaxID=37448 RepID=A0A6H2H6D5_9BURK|nr:class II aldolase/adducin family protein [Polaromonas vacuolata]QJC55327.1 4-hydroxy-3-prenylphenylpyruvate oxygenase/4-hydroxy-3-prenylbenzoate synthase [Polaromonas vacuolata]